MASENESPRPAAARSHWQPPPPDYSDPVIEAYKRDVDRTLRCANLTLSVAAHSIRM